MNQSQSHLGMSNNALSHPNDTATQPMQTMMHPSMMHPSMMQPGMMHPSMMQPGMMHPSMMHPSMMQPGVLDQSAGGPASPMARQAVDFTSCCAPAIPGMPIDPYICGPPTPDQSNCNPLAQHCDGTFALALLGAVLSIVGIALSVSVPQGDTLFTTLSGSTTLQLQSTYDAEVRVAQNTTNFPPFTSFAYWPNGTTLAPVLVSLYTAPNCFAQQLPAAYGTMCRSQYNLATHYILVAIFNSFRTSLYFIALVGTCAFIIIVFVAHRMKLQHLTNAGALHPSMPNPPIVVGIRLYHIFRFAWFCVSLTVFTYVTFFMYLYWALLPGLESSSVGDLRSFWERYDRAFVPGVVLPAIYVCWPLAHMVLEGALWVAFFIPWYLFRTMCKPGIGFVRYPPETPLDELPGWVRLDMFFTEFNQLKRLGFSYVMWEMVTEQTAPFIDCDLLAQPGAQPWGMQHPGMQPGMQPGTVHSQPQQVQQVRATSEGADSHVTSASRWQLPSGQPQSGLPQDIPMDDAPQDKPKKEKRDKRDKKDKRDKREKREKREKSSSHRDA